MESGYLRQSLPLLCLLLMSEFRVACRQSCMVHGCHYLQHYHNWYMTQGIHFSSSIEFYVPHSPLQDNGTQPNLMRTHHLDHLKKKKVYNMKFLPPLWDRLGLVFELKNGSALQINTQKVNRLFVVIPPIKWIHYIFYSSLSQSLSAFFIFGI